MEDVHISPYAGSWYPGGRAELDCLLAELFEHSRERTGPCALRDPLAFVVPHAGLMYSGTVAAAAYRSLAESTPSRIVLLGFAHRGGPSSVAIPDVKRIATPVGEVTVDRETAAMLARELPFEMAPEQRLCDHSVEIQLPLLMKAAPGVPVLPLYVGPLHRDSREKAAHALAALATTGTVFLASSDLTHYGASFGYQPFPPDHSVRDRLRDLDYDVIDAAGSLEPELFLEHLSSTGSTVCGYEPISLLLAMLRLLGDGIYQEALDYQTSAEITGEAHHSVSYAALGYFRAPSFELEREDRQLLLDSAHATLLNLLETGQRKPVPPAAVTPALTRRAGAFVSLYEGVGLRGCVGRHSGCDPLAQAIPELTLSAALDDPRFMPLRAAQCRVAIQISVLTPLKRLRGTAGFVLGRHGAYLHCGPRRSLLLPQVTRLRDWTREDFFCALARKAGLPPDNWSRPDARLSVFEAQVFGE
ncbi:MAG TPA: AmmeMemoRadiSam system protein B [Bryobacteraceae bacterium]|nr:AmmeMemoRadiSam system protein B [Bryobacteraceae bacterium]